METQPLKRTLETPTWKSITRKIEIAGFDMYATIGFHPETDQPGELFIKIAKEGSVVSGLVGEGVALATSMALRYGMPWAMIADKWKGAQFEPYDHKYKSILDAIAIEVTSVITDYGANPTLPITEKHNGNHDKNQTDQTATDSAGASERE